MTNILDEVLSPYPDGGPLLDRLRWWQDHAEDQRLKDDIEEICVLLTVAPRSAGDISREPKIGAAILAYAEAQRPYTPPPTIQGTSLWLLIPHRLRMYLLRNDGSS